ncbi:hypothetical protein GYMLUDRAFT_1017976 [Collybiopsis luxurians FD-317 M1]|uniref:Uncharacterized protein n=1 Tax=Collybiopsis luxurians FD-317 M1 TaxID=944289 RepID=A0A0D0AY70_9AGAR|nr:hypothetical protein GYMLUDRAFT_1017976 [Collybiopsis luxurians FD-317 M1]
MHHNSPARDILLSVISVSQIPPGEKLSSLKRTRSLYEGSSMSVHSDKDVPTSRPGAGSQQTAWRSQYNPSTNLSLESFNVNLGSDFADWSFPVTSNDLSGLPVHIDAGTDMDLPCDSVACNSESTLLPTQGIDGMIYELGTGQFTNSTSSR